MTITIKDREGLHIVNINRLCSIRTVGDDGYIHILFHNGQNMYLDYDSPIEAKEALEEISRLIEEKQK